MLVPPSDTARDPTGDVGVVSLEVCYDTHAMRPETAGGDITLRLVRSILSSGTAVGFPARLNAGTSDLWQQIHWPWVYQAARRCARRLGAENPVDDLAHDIALETVLALGDGLDLASSVNRAEGRVFRQHTPRGFRPQNAPHRFPGARLTPGDWHAVYTWLRRVLPYSLGRQILERTLEGMSLEHAADQLGLSMARAKQLRSRALATCRRVLESTK